MRHFIAILVVLVVLGVLAAVKGAQIGALMAHAEDSASMGPPAEAVGVSVAEEQVWEETLAAVGTVASGQNVAIRTEVPGVVSRIAFESGDVARRGQLLIELDAQVERADLAGAIANEQLTRTIEARTRSLASRGVSAADELDRAQADHDTAVARVAALRATIAKKTIRAPFAGRLGIRAVNLGQYLEAGATITEVAAREDDSLYVDFTLPQERIAALTTGMPVRVTLGDRVFEATLAAIEPAVDERTRAVALRAQLSSAVTELRPGMFVDVQVVLPQQRTIVVVPATAIVHAPYGDSLFLVTPRPSGAPGPRTTPDGQPIRAARQAFVRTGERRGDFIEIVEGVSAGSEVVSTGAFKLRNGSPMYASDEGTPTPELAPHPESR